MVVIHGGRMFDGYKSLNVLFYRTFVTTVKRVSL